VERPTRAPVGASLAAEHSGWFLETTIDSVFVSRFNDDLVNYIQHKIGYTNSYGGFKAQIFLGTDVTFDAKKQYWASFVEGGSGVRIHVPNTPPSLAITIAEMRGIYLVNRDNPWRPNYKDFRVSVWYAITK
jgi:hypothetical protein